MTLIYKNNSSELPTYRFNLDNGMTIILRECHANPLIAINFWVRAGSKYEKDEISGLSHYLEHMFRQGTKVHPGLAYRNGVLNTGGITGAITCYDWTMYYNLVGSQFFDIGLDGLTDALQNLIINEHEFEKEKNVIKDEIRKHLDSPSKFAFDELMALIFLEQPYGKRVIGSYQSIDAIKQDIMPDYYKTYYAPNNIIAVVVGDFKPDRALEKIKNAFIDFKPHKISFPNFAIPENAGVYKSATFYKDINEAILMMGFRIPGFSSPDRYALEVLISLLNDGKNSYFYKYIIMDKKLAVSINTFQLYLQDQDIFCIQATPSDHRKIDTLKKEILEVLINIKEKGFTAKELRKAIDGIKFKNLKKREDILEQATTLGLAEISGGMEYELNYLSNIEKITLDDVRRVANEYLFYNNLCILELLSEKLIKIEDKTYKDAQLRLGEKSAHIKFNFTEQLYPKKEIDSIKGEPVKFSFSPSGLSLIVQQNSFSPTVSMGVYVKYGAVNDNPPKMGNANLLMNLLATNTTKRNYEQIIEEISELGNDCFIDVKQDFSYIVFNLPAEKIEKGIELISDIIIHPLFKKEYLEVQKNIAISNLQKQEDELVSFTFQHFYKAIYSQHKYSRSIFGEIPGIKQVTIDDINRNYKEFFLPQNLVITVVGDVNTQKIKKWVSDYLSPYCNESKYSDKGENIFPSIASRRGEIILNKDKEQAYIIMGTLVGGINDDDYIPLMVLEYIINSRVFKEIIYTQKLAYSAFCEYRALKLGGSLGIHISISPENILRAKMELNKMFQRIISSEISEEELQNSKNGLTGAYYQKQQSNPDRLKTLAFFEIMGLGYEFKDKYIKLISEVTSKELLRVAKKYIDLNKLTTVIVSPK